MIAEIIGFIIGAAFYWGLVGLIISLFKFWKIIFYIKNNQSINKEQKLELLSLIVGLISPSILTGPLTNQMYDDINLKKVEMLLLAIHNNEKREEKPAEETKPEETNIQS